MMVPMDLPLSRREPGTQRARPTNPQARRQRSIEPARRSAKVSLLCSGKRYDTSPPVGYCAGSNWNPSVYNRQRKCSQQLSTRAVPSGTES